MKALLKILSTPIVITLTMFVMTFSSTSHAYDVINGNACVAANLTQAGGLMWDHGRILNPASASGPVWVTCTLATGTKYLRPANGGAGIEFTNAESGGVEVAFVSGAASNAEALCIFREMNSGSTSLTAADAKSVTISNDGEPLPNTKRGGFNVADGLNFSVQIGIFMQPSTTRTMTMTCRLDPGAGINAYHVNLTFPS